MTIKLTARERRRRLRQRHRRAKKAISLESSPYRSDRQAAAEYWAYVEYLDREIRVGA